VFANTINVFLFSAEISFTLFLRRRQR